MASVEIERAVEFSYVNLEHRVPQSHPLRRLRVLADDILEAMGLNHSHPAPAIRVSVAPDKLLRTLVLQVLYDIGIGRERHLMEELDYNLLFRWFVGLGVELPAFTLADFLSARDRFASQGLVREFFGRILSSADWEATAADTRFVPNRDLAEAWAAPEGPSGPGFAAREWTTTLPGAAPGQYRGTA